MVMLVEESVAAIVQSFLFNSLPSFSKGSSRRAEIEKQMIN